MKLNIYHIKAAAIRYSRILFENIGIIQKRYPICENIVLWAQDRGWEIKRVHEPFIIENPIPDVIKRDFRLHSLFQVVNGLGFPSQHLVTIPDAVVLGNRGFIRLKEGAYIAEGHWRVSNVVESPIYRNEWPIKKERSLPGDWYCLMGHWGANYHHWLWDEIPRLYSVIPYLPPAIKYILASDVQPYQIQSLAALGIYEQQCIRQDPYTKTKVGRLWFATPLGHSEQAATSPRIACELRQLYRRHFACSDKTCGRSFYISRAGARYRKINNEIEIINLLKDRGMQIIKSEEISFSDQVKMFGGASLIIGPHGAGLTNMLFSAPGTRILEFLGPQKPRFHYWMMAQILGHKYHCIVGYHNDTNDPQENPAEPSFSIDIEQLKKGLIEVMAL